MMENFIDLIKSSKELLTKCIELCDALESDFVSEELTNEIKEERLNKMIEGFKEITKKVNVAKKKSVKRKYNSNNNTVANGIQKSKGSSKKISDPNNSILDKKNVIKNISDLDEDSSIFSEDSSSINKSSNLCEEENNINNDKVVNFDKEDDISETDGKLVVDELLCDDFKINDENSTENKEINILDNIVNTDQNKENIINVPVFTSNSSDIGVINANLDNNITKDRNNIKQCSVILEDIVKSDKKGISDEDYFNNLEAEVNKLSKMPTFKNKPYSPNEREGKSKKSKKEKVISVSSKVFESDSMDSGSNSDEGSEVIDMTTEIMVDAPLSSTESEKSSESEEKSSESEKSSEELKKKMKQKSNGKVHSTNNLHGRRITRSLKIPQMSDNEISNKKSHKKGNGDKKASEKIDISASSSDDESDASASMLRSKNNNKRKKTTKSNVSNKKIKIEDDENQNDSDDVIEKRKNIRKIMTTAKLSEATKEAEQLEIDRRKRMEEKQQIYNDSLAIKDVTSVGTSSLVIETDQNGKPIVEVHGYIAEKLKPHQVEAVHFMYECVIENVQCHLKSQEEKGEDKLSSVGGCILAHCMGLGKTLSLIAFMHTMLTTPILNLYSCIIVCPVNTALNWKREWEMWVPSDRPVKLFELCSADKKQIKFSVVQDWYKKGGVLIVGYEMFRLLTAEDKRNIRSKVMRQKMQEALINPGADFIVCDEGHLLKNEKSAISKVINKVRTKCRIVLTGTPMQNKLIEYHTMVNFVKPNLLGTHKEFLNRFVNPISNGQHSNSTLYDVKVMKKRSHILYKTLDGCVHRRDYSALVKYLPPKYEYIIKIRMSEVQVKLYKEYLTNGKISKHAIFTDQCALARIWTHPFLVCMHQEIQDKKTFLAETEDESFIDDSSNDSSEKIEKKKLKPITEQPNTVNLISSDSDGEVIEKMEVDKNDDVKSESSADEVVKRWSTSTRRPTRSRFRDSDDEGKINFELENLREPVPTDKYWWSDIINYEHEHQIEASGKLSILFQILRKAEDMGDKVIIFSHSLLVLDIIEKYLQQLHNVAEKVKDDLQKLNESVLPKIDDEIKSLVLPKIDDEIKSLVLPKIDDEIKSSVLPKIDDEIKSSVLPKIDDEIKSSDITDGTKSSLVTDENASSEFKDEIKCSDFFLEKGYNTWEKGLDYERMDGSTHVGTRADIQSRFNSSTDPRLRLFLISTRAGGVGVNLVAANRVVIFDVSWNPSNDVQAIFRSYRFGQIKPVYVYRLVSQGTMEEKMYERQVTKQSISLRVVDEQQIGRYFTEEDLKSLYKFEPDIYDPEKERETPILPKDRFLAELIQEFPQWIQGYHEHDSLLQNKEEEELTETERQEAWKEFEDEKLHGTRPIPTHPVQVTFDPNHFAQLQMSQIQQQFPQYAAIYAQNYMNLLRYAINQQPDLKFNPTELGIRMNSIFFMSLQKYNNNINSSTTSVASIAPASSTKNVSVASVEETKNDPNQ